MACEKGTVSGYLALGLDPALEVVVYGDITAYLAKGLDPALEAGVQADISAYHSNVITPAGEDAAKWETLFYRANTTDAADEVYPTGALSAYCALGLAPELEGDQGVGVLAVYQALGIDPALEVYIDYSLDISCSNGIPFEYLRRSGLDEHRITQADVFRRYR